MATGTKKKQKGSMASNHEHTQPDWPTTMRGRLPGGRVLGIDGSVWVYRTVELAPVEDAKTTVMQMEPAGPILSAFDELSAMAVVKTSRRATAKGTYRNVHLLLVNTPDSYRVPNDFPNADYLNTEFADMEIKRRLLLFGVQLRPALGSGGFRSAIDSATEFIMMRGTPMSDFDKDYAQVSSALSRAGLGTPTDQDFALANSWWSTRSDPATPFVPHPGHLHVFNTIRSAQSAAEHGAQDCTSWPKIDGQYVITMASVKDFSLPFTPATTPYSRWVDALRDQGALAVSIRGLVEPSSITRSELRRRRRQYQEDIEERYKAQKMDRAEQTRLLAELTAVEAAYSDGGGVPTLVDASVMVALNGSHPDLYESAANRAFTLTEMSYRQSAGIAETWLASNVRANPNLHDIPVHTIAFSGLPSLSKVGDRTGAQIGVTRKDRQPSFISHIAASRGDGLPIMGIFGQTGSGKLLELSTKIPTPSGWMTMGDLKVGDKVLGRDGTPCAVTYLSPINEEPDLYRIHLSDGQSLDADAEHQWVVSTFWGRNAARHPTRITALATWNQAHQMADRIEEFAGGFTPDDEVSAYQLLDCLRAQFGASLRMGWTSDETVRESLAFMECPSRLAPTTRTIAVSEVRKHDPVKLYPVAATLDALVDYWNAASGGNARRWAGKLASKKAAASALKSRIGPDLEWTISEIARQLIAEGADMPHESRKNLAIGARWAGIEPRDAVIEVVAPRPTGKVVNCRPHSVYPTALAMKCMAERLRQRYSTRPHDGFVERRMTTSEMLAEGIRLSKDQARFAIRVSAPLDLPGADLAVPPYTFGLWLGDGATSFGQIFSGVAESCTDPDGLTDQAHCLEQLAADGFTPHLLPSAPELTVSVPGLRPRLRAAGVLGDKRIPARYLRASFQQRLSLLQGLMDSDGTIDALGGCELTLCKKDLAEDALELIRSLGIKVNMTEGEAAYTLADADGVKTRTVTGRRYRMHFTTTVPVFRLPRKLRRLPESVRETQDWLYITDIEKIDSVPGRCIQVDSPDHTYLAAGFVPTSNTMTMLWLAHQFAKAGVPQVIFDPKELSDLSIAVQASGGRVASLDTLTGSDGVLDPLRSAENPEAGLESALAMIQAVNPWGDSANNYATALSKALRIGVNRGGTATGHALRLALEAGEPAEVIRPILDLAESLPSFRACVGMDADAPALRFADGITLIKVGSNGLNLPAPGTERKEMSQSQRSAMNLVRMVTVGSMRAMSGRDGVLHLDEAWTVLSAGKSEMDQIGRTARSLRVLPILYTQRCTDALNADLTGYISRVLILPMTDHDEARAACILGGLEPTAERIAALSAKATIGESPNWRSMRALRDPVTGKNLRGAIGFYCDLNGQAIPVEVKIPPSFLALASTNADDMMRRSMLMEKQQEASILG
ncbi:MAG: ATP-binding protein [Nakamurella sp.]